MSNVPWSELDKPRIGTRILFDESTAASHQLIAGASGAKYRILRGWLQNLHTSTPCDIYFADDTGAISQTFRLDATDTANFGERRDDFWQSDNAGEALNLVMSAAVNVKGEIYVETWSM